MKAEEHIGKRYGRLVVFGLTTPHVQKNGKKRARVNCQCDCGKTIKIIIESLVTGNTKSCGCYRKQVTSKRRTTHGKSHTKTYRIWHAMNDRCELKTSPAYKYYGGRGIKVCVRWRNSFQAFIEDMGEAPDGLTLDRIDNNKGYYKSNCRWATMAVQTNNRNNTTYATHKGKTLTIAQWSRELNIPYATIYSRFKNNRPITG